MDVACNMFVCLLLFSQEPVFWSVFSSWVTPLFTLQTLNCDSESVYFGFYLTKLKSIDMLFLFSMFHFDPRNMHTINVTAWLQTQTKTGVEFIANTSEMFNFHEARSEAPLKIK